MKGGKVMIEQDAMKNFEALTYRSGFKRIP